jgi:hypothetical protein
MTVERSFNFCMPRGNSLLFSPNFSMDREFVIIDQLWRKTPPFRKSPDEKKDEKGGNAEGLKQDVMSNPMVRIGAHRLISLG